MLQNATPNCLATLAFAAAFFFVLLKSFWLP